MILSCLLMFLVPAITGFLLVHFIWPDKRVMPENILFKIFLGTGAGFGISSLSFFAWVIMLGPDKGIMPSILTEISCSAILLPLILLAGKGKTVIDSNDYPLLPGSTIRHDTLYKNLLGFTCVVFIISAIPFTLGIFRDSHGSWDAQGIWNIHARFLFRGGDNWRSLFSGAIAHSDYPLLLPGLIARCWKLFGKDTARIPVLVAMFFTFATAGVLVTSLSMVKKRIEGLLGGMVLLATPSFIQYGASQCADVPLAFYFCATLSLFMIIDHSYEKNRRLLLLCGFLAGLAAWTKNEGVAFIASIMAARLIITWRLKGLKTCVSETILLIVGVIPAALAIGYLKVHLAPPSDLFVSKCIVTNLTSLPRYFYITTSFIKEFAQFGGFYIGVIPLLLMYLMIRGAAVNKKNIPTLLTLFFVSIFMIISYFFIYLITPHDLSWHVGSSINRLVLQLWPGIILFVFLMVKPIEKESM